MLVNHLKEILREDGIGIWLDELFVFSNLRASDFRVPENVQIIEHRNPGGVYESYLLKVRDRWRASLYFEGGEFSLLYVIHADWAPSDQIDSERLLEFADAGRAVIRRDLWHVFSGRDFKTDIPCFMLSPLITKIKQE